LKSPVGRAYLLATAKEIAFKTGGGGVDLMLPSVAPDSIASVIVLTFRGEPVVPLIPSVGKAATASSEENGDGVAAKAFDANLQTAWHAAKTDTTAWLSVDLGAPVKISAVFMKESGERERKIKAYRYEYLDGGEWKLLFEGGKIGQGMLKPIAPVTARVFRLVITSAAPGIQLCEMTLLSE
jgi:alpha-L-fucosidase